MKEEKKNVLWRLIMVRSPYAYEHNDEQLLDMCRIVKQLSSCCRNIRLVANLLDLNNKQKKKEMKKIKRKMTWRVNVRKS